MVSKNRALPSINPSNVAGQELAQHLAEGYEALIKKALILGGFIKEEDFIKEEEQERILQYATQHLTRTSPLPGLDLFYHDGFPFLQIKTTFDKTNPSKLVATQKPIFYHPDGSVNNE